MPTTKWLQTHALDPATTGIGTEYIILFTKQLEVALYFINDSLIKN
jgi:hypothetical protein